MTQKIKAIIIDDEAKSRKILQKMLDKYCPDLEVVAQAASTKEAYILVQQTQPNVLFLDIEMPHGSGFDLLKQLPEINFEVIFVTGFDHYALKAIKYHALDYLLKPVDIDELIAAVAKVTNHLNKKLDSERIEKLLLNLQNSNKGQQQIAIVSHDGWEFIPVNQIMYCTADAGYTKFYLENNRTILSSKNLGEYEKILPKPNGQFQHHFFRIHHSYIINLSYIRKFNRQKKHVEMKDGIKIAIAQRRAAQFSDFLRGMGLL